MSRELSRRAPAETGEAGYTLTEMLIVIVIIGLIAAAVTPSIIGQLGGARARAARVQMETVAAALETFRADMGHYPFPGQGLAALASAPSDAPNWLGPYVRASDTLNDPWGKPLLYETDADGGNFTLTTLGADGKPAGDGAAQDIAISSSGGF